MILFTLFFIFFLFLLYISLLDSGRRRATRLVCLSLTSHGSGLCPGSICAFSFSPLVHRPPSPMLLFILHCDPTRCQLTLPCRQQKGKQGHWGLRVGAARPISGQAYPLHVCCISLVFALCTPLRTCPILGCCRAWGPPSTSRDTTS